MHRHRQPTMNRRGFVRLAGTLGLGGTATTSTGTAAEASSERHALDEVDDEGNPVEPTLRTAAVRRPTGGSLGILATTGSDPERAGRIVSNRFRWISPGAPRTGHQYALRIADRGGVDIGFRFVTPSDLTIDTQFRFHSGWDLGYLFNDVDSVKNGFRAFTNGRARRGLVFRNPFGGNDLEYRGNVQDGAWHWLRVVLDADARSLVVFIDGERIGRSSYHGNGWSSLDQFRVMGRRSGSDTLMEYDRFVMTDRAIYPSDAESIASTVVHYGLEDGDGRTLANRPVEGIGDLVDRKRDLIEEIREHGGRVLPSARASALDRGVEPILDDVEGGGPNVADGTREALSRLVAAEKITLAATTSGVVPTERTAETVVTLAKSMAVGGLAKRALRTGSWAARRIRSILRDLVARVRRTVEALVARPVLVPAVRRRIDAIVGEVHELIGEYVETHREALVGVGETLLKSPIEDAIDGLATEARSDLDGIRSDTAEALAEVIYDRYQFGPAETAPGPTASGINTAIEATVAPIASIVSAGTEPIEFEAGEDFEAVRDEVVAEIERREAQFLAGIDASEAASEAASTYGLVIAVIALGAFAVAAGTGATGVGIPVGVTAATIGAKLKLYAAMLGGISVVLLAGATAIGVGYLRHTRSLHADAVGAMLEPRHDAGAST